VSIDRFLSFMNANGGMSMSNHYKVSMDIPGGEVFTWLCDEAQLPNVNAASGTIKGRYLGEGQVNYPHTRIFTEMQLGFQCDANMTPLKILNDWFGKIFVEYQEQDGMTKEYASMDEGFGSPFDTQILQRVKNRTVRLNYPDSFCRNIYVTKTERGPADNAGVRTSMTYVMERAWPFAIDAVPLQYGSANITKVTAQFYYTKHRIVYNNINHTNAIDSFNRFLM